MAAVIRRVTLAALAAVALTVVGANAASRFRRAAGSMCQAGRRPQLAAPHGDRGDPAETAGYFFASMSSRPPMNGRSAAGITTEPSFC